MAFAQSNAGLFSNPTANGIKILLEEDDIRAVEREKLDELRRRGMPDDWARVGLVYEDQFMRILRDAVIFPDGHCGTYIRLVRAAGTAAGAR